MAVGVPMRRNELEIILRSSRRCSGPQVVLVNIWRELLSRLVEAVPNLAGVNFLSDNLGSFLETVCRVLTVMPRLRFRERPLHNLQDHFRDLMSDYTFLHAPIVGTVSIPIAHFDFLIGGHDRLAALRTFRDRSSPSRQGSDTAI